MIKAWILSDKAVFSFQELFFHIIEIHLKHKSHSISGQLEGCERISSSCSWDKNSRAQFDLPDVNIAEAWTAAVKIGFSPTQH